MMRVVTEYFTSLFDTSRPEISVDQVDFIDQRDSNDMADQLSRPFSRLEIEAALSDMHPCKSPGPDGFPALFYKKYWGLVGDDVCAVVLDFLNHGFMPDDINFTHVVLIPKTKNPKKMTELHPSVCAMSPINLWRRFWQID